MASNRHLCRIIALQTLYENDFRNSLELKELETDIDEILERNIAVYKDAIDEADFVSDLVKGTLKNQDKIDEEEIKSGKLRSRMQDMIDNINNLSIP